jgi:hypothetical protein
MKELHLSHVDLADTFGTLAHNPQWSLHIQMRLTNNVVC